MLLRILWWTWSGLWGDHLSARIESQHGILPLGQFLRWHFTSWCLVNSELMLTLEVLWNSIKNPLVMCPHWWLDRTMMAKDVHRAMVRSSWFFLEHVFVYVCFPFWRAWAKPWQDKLGLVQEFKLLGPSCELYLVNMSCLSLEFSRTITKRYKAIHTLPSHPCTHCFGILWPCLRSGSSWMTSGVARKTLRLDTSVCPSEDSVKVELGMFWVHVDSDRQLKLANHIREVLSNAWMPREQLAPAKSFVSGWTWREKASRTVVEFCRLCN